VACPCGGGSEDPISSEISGNIAIILKNLTQEQPDSQARTVAGQIELALAEYSNGHLSMNDLRERLAELPGGQGLGANQNS